MAETRLRLRTPRPLELAAYLAWSADLVDRANRRWVEVRPAGAPLKLVDRAALSSGLIRRLIGPALPAGYNSRQASMWAAAAYADSPSDVRSAARDCLLDLHDRAIAPTD
jgi:hypothetical protein